MGWVASSTPAPGGQAVPNFCNPNKPKTDKPEIYSPERLTPSISGPYTGGGNTLVGLNKINAQSITFPAASFLLQDGALEPIYPDFYGAFVYDLHYKKWGKAKHDYRRMFEMYPINSQSGKIVPYEVFGSDTAIIDSIGDIYLHDKFPNDSKISWGKIGYFRKGFTDAEEVKLQLADVGTGILSLDGSLDGKNLSPFMSLALGFENATTVILYSGLSARWYNVTVSGIFDISGLEFRGHKRGDR